MGAIVAAGPGPDNRVMPVECAMADKDEAEGRIAVNRRARHEYFLSDHLEAGMVLSGTEVKSVKDGGMQLTDAYGLIENNELWLVNAHISHYGHGNIHNHEPGRKRKLLVHRKEINRLVGKTREKGLTLITESDLLDASEEDGDGGFDDMGS